QEGSVDFAIISTAPLAGFTDAFLIYDLPFIFPDTKTARRVLDGPFGEKTLKFLASQGIIGLVFFENGFRHITNSKKPVVLPSDMEGMKIRTMENSIHKASFQAIGAIPYPLSFGELYPALQKKTLDAQENPVPIIYTSKFYQVQKYCSLTGHFYSPTPVLFSAAAWNQLTEEQRKIIETAAYEAREYQRDLIDKQNAEFISKLQDEGMEIVEIDKVIWYEAMLPVYQTFESQGGSEVLKEIQAIINEPQEGTEPTSNVTSVSSN
ncbi:MAG: DctP family TRAP transporter solute-binding subunit, partial [Deltaproteobacteria bacterium]|nr:DctP family TRAP transporter solute-binding subunit [Deltaproteobacteria bacterium]